jgi:DNA-binding NtrC family response regulator
MEEPSFVITPGLSNVVIEFESHLKVAQGKPILVTGPSGTGKSLLIEIFKRYHHSINPKTTPVVINCAAFPETLIESELFGHKKGAFTGAASNRKGWLDQPDGGLLVLEEIGELKRYTQAKLLIYLQSGEFCPVGDTTIKRSKVQILGTTNRDHEPGRASRFRDDFWYRFSHFYIHPLHSRRPDILYLLIEKYPKIAKTLAFEDILFLLAYNWPGNVRELESVALKLNRLRDILGEKAYEDPRSASKLFTMELRYKNPFKAMAHNYWKLQTILLPHLLKRNDQTLFGFSRSGKQYRPFKKLPTLKREKTKFDMPKLLKEDSIRAIYRSFELFCAILHLDHSEDSNLLDLKRSIIHDSFYKLKNEFTVDDALYRLSRQIYFERLSDQQPQVAVKKSIDDQELQPSHGESEASFLEKVKDLIAGLKQDELLKFYHETLLERTSGNRSKAAEMAGVSARTMQKSNPTGRRSKREKGHNNT